MDEAQTIMLVHLLSFLNISKNKETSASAGEFAVEKLIDPQWEDKNGVIF